MGTLLALLLAAQPRPALTAKVRVGEQRVADLPGLVRVACGCHGVDVKTLGDDALLLVGLRQGRSELVLWFDDGTRASLVVDVLPGWLPTPVRPRGPARRPAPSPARH
jgi:hypothetical protein